MIADCKEGTKSKYMDSVENLLELLDLWSQKAMRTDVMVFL